MPESEIRTDERLIALVAKRTAVEEQLKIANEYRSNFDRYIAVCSRRLQIDDDESHRLDARGRDARGRARGEQLDGRRRRCRQVDAVDGNVHVLLLCVRHRDDDELNRAAHVALLRAPRKANFFRHRKQGESRAARREPAGEARRGASESTASRLQVRVNPYGILCEEFDRTSKTYCKRLRVVCPEHSHKDRIGKSMKVGDCSTIFRIYAPPIADLRLFARLGARLVQGRKRDARRSRRERARRRCVYSSARRLHRSSTVGAGKRAIGVDRRRLAAAAATRRAFQNLAALIDNLRMSYLLQIEDLLDVYRQLCIFCQSHSNIFVHMLASTTKHASENVDDDEARRATVNVDIRPWTADSLPLAATVDIAAIKFECS